MNMYWSIYEDGTISHYTAPTDVHAIMRTMEHEKARLGWQIRTSENNTVVARWRPGKDEPLYRDPRSIASIARELSLPGGAALGYRSSIFYDYQLDSFRNAISPYIYVDSESIYTTQSYWTERK